MITIGTLNDLQRAFTSVIRGEVSLARAQRDLAGAGRLQGEELGWARAVLHELVALKNRHRTIIEQFTEAHPEKEDDPLDIRLILAIRGRGLKHPTRVDRAVQALLDAKSRPRRLLAYLDEHPPERLFPSRTAEPLAHLWRYHSHPIWMLRKWWGAFDQADVEKMCRFNNTPPAAAVRVRPGGENDRDSIADRLRQAGVRCQPSRVSPLGLLLDRAVDTRSLAEYTAGQITPQDLAEQLAGLFINPRPGSRVLDFHTDDGGLSLLLAHLMAGRGELWAHDRQAWRLDRLRRRSREERLDNLRLAEGDPAAIPAGSFDRVVLAAPCSGSGDLQHRPELRWTLVREDLPRFNKLQLSILDQAAPGCRPGGYLFYLTRSLFPEENGRVIRRFLGSRPGWTLLPAADFLAADHQAARWTAPDRFAPYLSGDFLQILPHRHGLPGIFVAVLRRDG